MYCRACGMESRTTDRCEWCKKPLLPLPGQPPLVGPPTQTAAPPPQTPPLTGGTAQPLARPLNEMTQPIQASLLNGPQPSAAPYAPPVRTTLTGAVIETPPPAFPATPPPMYPAGGPAASDPVLSPVAAGLPMAAVTAESLRGQIENEYESPFTDRLEKSLAICMPLLVLSLVLARFVPYAGLWMVAADMFFVPLALGATGALPSYDDAIMDCTAVLIAAFLLGPLVAIGVYGFVGLLKQEWNVPVLVVLLLNILIRALFILAFPNAGEFFVLGTLFGIFSGFVGAFLGFLGLSLSFGGWMMSSFFRPLDAAD